MAAGYSARRLVAKLGVKPGTRIVALEAPDDYRRLLGSLPEGALIVDRPGASERFVHGFIRDRTSLVRLVEKAERILEPDGTFWVSWPKRASGVPTDVTEDVVRAVALEAGLVDIKVCAVDEIWSGLKLVRRLRDRPRKRN